MGRCRAVPAGRREGALMLDTILILLVMGLFAAAIAYAYGCEGL